MGSEVKHITLENNKQKVAIFFIPRLPATFFFLFFFFSFLPSSFATFRNLMRERKREVRREKREGKKALVRDMTMQVWSLPALHHFHWVPYNTTLGDTLRCMLTPTFSLIIIRSRSRSRSSVTARQGQSARSSKQKKSGRDQGTETNKVEVDLVPERLSH